MLAPIEKTWSMLQLPSKPQDVEGAVGRQCQGQRSWAMPIACCTWNKMSRQTRVLPTKSPAKAGSSMRSVRAPLTNEADSFRKSFPSLERARRQPAGCASRGRLRPRICGPPCRPQACRRHTSPGKGWPTASHCLAVCRSVSDITSRSTSLPALARVSSVVPCAVPASSPRLAPILRRRLVWSAYAGAK